MQKESKYIGYVGEKWGGRETRNGCKITSRLDIASCILPSGNNDLVIVKKNDKSKSKQ